MPTQAHILPAVEASPRRARRPAVKGPTSTNVKEDTATRLMESIAANRLSVLCGAGLSMAYPSSIPGAGQVNTFCIAEYERRVGSAVPDAAKGDIEKLASWFRANGRFNDLFIRTLVPWAKFNTEPNAGHDAIADFLACGVAREGVTTNFDRLVESAARSLGEPDFRAIADTQDLADTPAHRPYLKVHGCEGRNRSSTIWCKGQFDEAMLRTRADHFRNWLVTNLLGRDVLIVGFWSDWAYLSEIFASSLPALGPCTVFLAAPASAADLAAKAPELWKWAHGDQVTFIHEAESGDTFLDELRRRVSTVFLNRVFDSAGSTYLGLFGEQPKHNAKQLTGKSSLELYALRRDVTGVPRNRPVRDKDPQPRFDTHSAFHQRLLDHGAEYSAHTYRFGGEVFRLVSGHGQLLSRVRATFADEPALPVPGHRVICLGAIDDGAAVNVVRPDAQPSILNGGTVPTWTGQDPLAAQLRATHV